MISAQKRDTRAILLKTASARVSCIQNTQIIGETIAKVFEKVDTFWTYHGPVFCEKGRAFSPSRATNQLSAATRPASCCMIGGASHPVGNPKRKVWWHISKFPSVWNQGLIKPVAETNHFWRLMLADLATLQTICLWHLSGRSSTPAATWNLHTTQPKYFAPTSIERLSISPVCYNKGLIVSCGKRYLFARK
jgi:hypothetical protein